MLAGHQHHRADATRHALRGAGQTVGKQQSSALSAAAMKVGESGSSLIFTAPALEGVGHGGAAEATREALLSRAGDILNASWEDSTRRSYDRAL